MRPTPSSRGDDVPPTSRVRVLPDALVDQIAAGEVVERPSSVVKELVENALDAGASRVRVEVRDGGASFIAVTDDGVGMSPEDAALALQRHATSKVASLDDLARIASYGFRGEALPAIASVSRLRLRTRLRGSAGAFEICVDAGRLVSSHPAGGPEGTRIEVADLFACVPARRKFLKAATTEWGHVSDWVARAALARPDVHFDLQRDDRQAIGWPATRDPLDRIAAVLSEDEAAAMVAVRRESGALCIHGFVSRPDWHRGNAESIHLFINARPVRDRLLRHALLDVYRDVLPRGRFPAALLFVDMPPDAVDVNVHPAKWEVRFADPRTIHREVAQAVRDALATRAWIPGVGASMSPTPIGVSTRAPSRDDDERAPGDTSLEGGRRTPDSDWVFAAPRRNASQGSLLEDAESVVDLGRGAVIDVASQRPAFSAMRLIGQLRAAYLVLDSKDGLVLVDQHAAHERVLYERLRASWLSGGVARQPLLIAASITLEPSARVALLDNQHTLLQLGFEIEEFGEGAILLRAIPALLAGRDPMPLVRALADELRGAASAGVRQATSIRLLDALDHVFATLACHSARTQGEALDPREQQALLRALDDIPWAPTCPHGRPVAVPFLTAEIERRFGRR